MAILQFSKFSPGGNDTVFLHSTSGNPAVGSAALKMLGGEQAGFVNLASKSLMMAGGEFCVNASRAFGALLDLHGHDHHVPCTWSAPHRHYKIRVSGWKTDINLDVSGEMPNWQISAKLILPECRIEILDARHTLVRLPGICHLLCFDGMPPVYSEKSAFMIEAERKRRNFDLEKEEALGIIGCQKYDDNRFTLAPYVIVPAVGTAMIEGCCGSASLALALLQYKLGFADKLRIDNPQSDLYVSLEQNESGLEARISGPVNFMLQGELNTDFLFL